MTGDHTGDPSPPRSHVTVPADPRIRYFVSLTHENCTTVASAWQRTDATPEAVARLLDRATQQFAMGAVTYDDLTEAVFTAMRACELALKERLGDRQPARGGLGPLIQCAVAEGVIHADRVEWWDRFIRPLRNKFAHADPVLFSPGMASGTLASLFASIAALFPDSAIPL